MSKRLVLLFVLLALWPSGSEAVLRGKVGLGDLWYRVISENTDL